MHQVERGKRLGVMQWCTRRSPRRDARIKRRKRLGVIQALLLRFRLTHERWKPTDTEELLNHIAKLKPHDLPA